MGLDGWQSQRIWHATTGMAAHHAANACSRIVLLSIFAVVCLIMIAGLRQSHDSRPLPSHSSSTALSQHPIESLIQESRQAFAETLRRQSTTLEAAIATYRARYKHDPPPGFDKWFDFAQIRRSPIIDDYDIITDAIAPLLKISGARINEMIEEAYNSKASLYKCGYRGGQHFGYCGRWDPSWYMAPVEYLLPDVELLISDLDEPRVLPDPVVKSRSTKVKFLNYSHKDVRGLYWSLCSSKMTPSSEAHDALPFISDAKQAKDLCRNPAYANQHGFVLSPSTLWSTAQTVPILSPAKASVFGDLIYPNPVYAEDYYDPRVYDEEKDIDWSEKHNDLYWSGSNEGGWFDDFRWQQSHRQRMVGTTNGLINTTTSFLTESTPGVWTSHTSIDMHPGLFNVHFSEIGSATCGQQGCKAQRGTFATTGRQSNNEQLNHRFVMDLDGWTFSRKFYTHLRSRSLPFKQTIFQEWHDDRLVPWVHYVPVSMSLKELPEMVRYFALTKKGQQYAQEIAAEGREWWQRAFRKEDMQVYMYRLILEYNRLRDPTRPASS